MSRPAAALSQENFLLPRSFIVFAVRRFNSIFTIIRSDLDLISYSFSFLEVALINLIMAAVVLKLIVLSRKVIFILLLLILSLWGAHDLESRASRPASEAGRLLSRHCCSQSFACGWERE